MSLFLVWGVWGRILRMIPKKHETKLKWGVSMHLNMARF